MKRKKIRLMKFYFVEIIFIVFGVRFILEGLLHPESKGLFFCIAFFPDILFRLPEIIAVWKSRLKKTGDCRRLPIITIEANSRRSVNGTYPQYVMVGDNNHSYKSPEVFYDLYSMFKEGDMLLVYISQTNPNRYFVDLNSCESPQTMQGISDDLFSQMTNATSQAYDSPYYDNPSSPNDTLYSDTEDDTYATSTISYTTSNAPSDPKDSPYGDIDDNIR